MSRGVLAVLVWSGSVSGGREGSLAFWTCAPCPAGVWLLFHLPSNELACFLGGRAAPATPLTSTLSPPPAPAPRGRVSALLPTPPPPEPLPFPRRFHSFLGKNTDTDTNRCPKTNAQKLGGRKEHSKIARLKRHLEKMGFKGILSDSKESGGGGSGGSGGRSNRGDPRKPPSSARSPRSPRGGGGSATTTPGGQLVRATSLTLASPTQHGYGGGGGGGGALGGRFGSSPGGGKGLAVAVAAAAGGGDGGRGRGRGRGGGQRAEPSSPMSLASLSPGRVRSSIGMGGRRLSAWTLGGDMAAAAAATEALRAEGKEERIPQVSLLQGVFPSLADAGGVAGRLRWPLGWLIGAV